MTIKERIEDTLHAYRWGNADGLSVSEWDKVVAHFHSVFKAPHRGVGLEGAVWEQAWISCQELYP